MNDKSKGNEPKCDGSCGEHVGEIVRVTIKGWGNFNYCETAIAEDEIRGFEVEYDHE